MALLHATVTGLNVMDRQLGSMQFAEMFLPTALAIDRPYPLYISSPIQYLNAWAPSRNYGSFRYSDRPPWHYFLVCATPGFLICISSSPSVTDTESMLLMRVFVCDRFDQVHPVMLRISNVPVTGKSTRFVQPL